MYSIQPTALAYAASSSPSPGSQTGFGAIGDSLKNFWSGLVANKTRLAIVMLVIGFILIFIMTRPKKTKAAKHGDSVYALF